MNFKTTIVLLILLAVGAGVAFYVKNRGETAPEEKPEEKKDDVRYVFDPQPAEADMTRLVVKRTGKPDLVFEREPKPEGADAATPAPEWRMVEPVEAPTESWRVGNLVTSFGRTRYRSSFEPGSAAGVTAEQAGLAQPAGSVTMIEKGGRQYVVEVGAKPAMSDDTYIRIAGKPTIYRADRDLVRELEKEAKEYRKKRLFNLTPADATHLHVELEGQTFDLTRGEGGKWVMNEPVKAHANTAKVEELIRNINAVSVDEFIEDAPQDLAAYGLSNPTMRISVTTEKRIEVTPPAEEPPATQPAEPTFETVTEEHALEIGSFADMAEQKRYLKLAGQPWVASVAVNTVNNMTPKLTDLRDASIIQAGKGDATALTLEVAGESATLRREGAKWTGEGDLAELDASAVDDVLNALVDLRALQWIDDPAAQQAADAGLDSPRATLTLTTRDSVEPITVRIGATTQSGRNAYVKIEGRPTLYVVDAALADRLVTPPIALHSRAVFEPAGGSIVALDVTRPPMHYVLASTNGEWTVTEPSGAQPDAAGVRELTSNLMSLRASKVVGRGDFDRFELPEPELIIRFTHEAPPETPASQPAGPVASQPAGERSEHVLRVGRKGRIPFARLDDGLIYELDETVYRALNAELIDRQLFTFAPESVTAVKVDKPTQPLDFELRDGQWVYTIDPTVVLDQQKVKDYVKALGGFRADHWLIWEGADLAAEGLDQAPVTATITLAEGDPIELRMLTNAPVGQPRKAALVGPNRVFTLRAGDADRLLHTLDQLVKSEPAATPPEFPPGAGQP